MVGHDVVQLPGDAEPLGEHRLPLEVAALPGDGARLLGQPGALAGGAPGHLSTDDGATEVDDVDDRRDEHRGGHGPEEADLVRDVLGEVGAQLVDARAEGELPGQPEEHGEHDRPDDERHVAPAAGPCDTGEDRREVDDLHGELAHDLRHRDAHDEHVQRREDGHGERPAATADQQQAADHHRDVLHPDRLAGLLEGADAAHHLEEQGGQHHGARRDDDVDPRHRAAPLPRVLEREEAGDPRTHGRRAGGHPPSLGSAHPAAPPPVVGRRRRRPQPTVGRERSTGTEPVLVDGERDLVRDRP